MSSKLIDDFYRAFAEKDAETMVKSYHPNVTFSDPAFGTLKGERAKNMWRMLCQSQKDKEFKVIHSDLMILGEEGSVKWEAFYNFSKTGRKVHNVIDAKFEFKDGLIIKHTDTFDLHKWAKQALGFKGWLIGGTSFFQKKLQAQTNRLLDKFEAKNK